MTYIFYCRPQLHILSTWWQVLWIVLSQPITAQVVIWNFQFAAKWFAGKSHGETHQNSTIRCGVCSMAAKGDTQKKPVKGGIDRNGKDNCRLCCCLLKIKFGEFKKTSYISSQNLFKVSKPDGFQDGTLSEICSKIGLEIKKVRDFILSCVPCLCSEN